MEELKTCNICRSPFPRTSEYFYKDKRAKDGFQSCCKKCRIIYHTNWRARNPDKIRKSYLKCSYNITEEYYNKMLKKQKAVCAICKRKPEQERFKVLAIDHCHNSNKIRGLLCDRCNRGVGYFNHDPTTLRAAAKYLEEAENE